MSLSYRKFSAEEDKMRGLIPDGQYPSRIDAIEVTRSAGGIDKNGNEKPKILMAVVDLTIDVNGVPRKHKDWVMLEGEMAWKFRHLCDACGKLEDYDNETIKIPVLVGARPYVDVKIKDSKDQYGSTIKRSVIQDYIKPAVNSESGEFLNDEIPF